ncbi:hypothetical protein C8F01DRAFT_1083660 [Mycena amicta]|nr:hypothetical protein C8F01DRAFT_1083660 [Mycena amicta]
MSTTSNSSRSSVLSRHLAAARARIVELELALASLSVSQPPSPESAASSARRHVRHLGGGITRPGPRLIPLPTASDTVSRSETIHSDSDSDRSVIIIPDSDDEPASTETPPPPLPETPPPPPLPVTARREYLYSSPTVPPTHTTEWSQAAKATQGVANGHVRLVAREPAPRKKAVCWVVFRGRENGIFHQWNLAEAATAGFRLAVYQGYTNVSDAERAYNYAVERRYTSTQPQASGLALPLAQIPASMVDENNDVDEARLVPRAADDPWYIVYRGVNPGIYPTYLEVALNTNGVSLAGHDSRETLADAILAFHGAKLRGDVQVRRQPKRP